MEMSPDGAHHGDSKDASTSTVMRTPPANEEPLLEHRVSFFPILSEQRKLWLLTIIREERVSSLLDVGCGEGSLLWSLSNPAFWLPDTLPGFIYAHIRTLHGLDVSAQSLKYAHDAITPSRISPYSLPRWEPLTASLWHGGLQKVNEEFRGIECIIASEVIEHLPPRAFAAFAPVLLGYYAPRLLLLTTPSYSFNRLFVSPPPTTPGKEDPWTTWGYASPTQPGRRMRHDDHQFEWTPAEAREWCTSVGETWGYDFRLGGVGLASEADPWGRTVDDGDEEVGGRASLVVEFRRREGAAEEGKRRSAWDAWNTGEGADYAEDAPHERVATVEHVPHERGGKPLPDGEITQATRQALRERRSASAHIGEIWDRVALACGGSRAAFMSALDKDPIFQVVGDDGDAQRWSVVLLGEEGELAENWREEPVEDIHEDLNAGGGYEGEEDEEVDEGYWEDAGVGTVVQNQENAWWPAEVSNTNNSWDTGGRNGWGIDPEHGGWDASSDNGDWTNSGNEGNWSGWGETNTHHEQ